MPRPNIWKLSFGLVLLAAACLLLAGGGVNGVAAAAGKHGFDVSDLDTTCKACDNFFQFATGGWIAHNPIQPAYPSWGRFNALQEQNQEVLRKILEAAAASRSAPGSIEQKIGDFYASCMDEKRIEAAGRQAAAAGVRAHRQNRQSAAA